MTKTYTPVSSKPKLRYWAVRLGEFVEFRVWSQQPTKLVSKLTKTTIETKRKYTYAADGTVTWKMEPIEVKNVLKQTIYVGGKVLGVVKASDIHYFLSVPVDGRVEITKSVKDNILKGYKNWG